MNNGFIQAPVDKMFVDKMEDDTHRLYKVEIKQGDSTVVGYMTLTSDSPDLKTRDTVDDSPVPSEVSMPMPPNPVSPAASALSEPEIPPSPHAQVSSALPPPPVSPAVAAPASPSPAMRNVPIDTHAFPSLAQAAAMKKPPAYASMVGKAGKPRPMSAEERKMIQARATGQLVDCAEKCCHRKMLVGSPNCGEDCMKAGPRDTRCKHQYRAHSPGSKTHLQCQRKTFGDESFCMVCFVSSSPHLSRDIKNNFLEHAHDNYEIWRKRPKCIGGCGNFGIFDVRARLQRPTCASCYKAGVRE